MISLVLWFISIIGIVVVSRYLYQTRKWNNGISKETMKPWILYEYNSNGRFYFSIGTNIDGVGVKCIHINFTSIDNK